MFGSLRNDPITSILPAPTIRTGASTRSRAGAAERQSATAPVLTTARGETLSPGELQDQFLVFQFNDQEQGARILETSAVKPKRKGSAEKPDVLARLQLVAFHIGQNAGIDKDTRATLRIDLGKDENSNSTLNTVFWSIAAGLNLYNQSQKKTAEAKDLKADFNEAFSKRPIEIAGGLGKLSFEVVKHKEPSWWRKIFSFLQSGTGEALTAAVGFPAITNQAISMLDELVGRLENSKPEVLFKSRPMTLALTELARDEYVGGTPGVSVGTLNPGFCLLARGRDYKTLVTNNPVFMGAYGKLRPDQVSVSDFLNGDFDDPFANMTYGVLRVASAETKLDPSLSFT